MPPAEPPDPDQNWVRALRALIKPGLRCALLETSPLLEHPAVLARAGKGATREARAEALIDLLVEVVDKRLHDNDKTAAQMLLALGQWSGRSVTERHRAVAKLRNRHWDWTHNYRKEPLTRDLTRILLALKRTVTEPVQSPAPPEAAPSDQVTALSGELVRVLGRRRTASLLDMSLRELHSAELLIETRVACYHKRWGSGPALTLESVMRSLSEGRSVLLLGEPGAGKSVALYDLVQRSLRQGLLPFPAPACDHGEMLSRTEWPGLKDLPEAVLFLDGLDEAAADGEDLARDLREMLRLRPTLLTSRLREYEHELSPLLADAGFDEVYVLLPWRLETEFADFLGRLNRADVLGEPAPLYNAVSARTDLSDIVTRPLYARMLTFIGESAARDVADPKTLYDEYLTKLAGTVGAGSDALSIWQAAAWAVHSSSVPAGGPMVIDDLIGALPAGHDPWQVRRTLDHILNTRTVRNREVGEFLHFSFFEYLVAAHVCDTLLDRPDAPTIHELLRHDLTREIRHHLIAQLKAAPLRELRERLADAYRVARSAGTTSEVQAVCNLLVYLLSRSVPRSETVLVDLLGQEDDPFLSAAILWALCHRGAPGMDREFFQRLDRDPNLRALCRGYVLYYYGDMDRDDGPPYSDEPPYRSCSNTLRTIMDVFERSTYIEKVSAIRRAIDLYTFLDLLIVRNHPISRDGLESLHHFHEALRHEQVDVTLWHRLAEMNNLLQPL